MEKEPIKITDELHNKLVDSFIKRAAAHGIRGKNKQIAQADFFAGAVGVIDLINGTKESCCTPRIFFSLLRGEEIKLIEPKG